MTDTAVRRPGPRGDHAKADALRGRLKALSGRPLIRRAFVERGLDRLLRFAEDLDEALLAGVVSAPTDFEFLLRLLEKGEIRDLLGGDEPLQAARIRGLRARADLLQAEGGVWSAPAVAEHLGISRQAVDKRRKAGTLLGLPVGRHGYAYPVWQFVRKGILEGLEATLKALAGHDAWTTASFLVQSQVRLRGERPLDLLRRGDLAKVTRAAAVFGEHGSD